MKDLGLTPHIFLAMIVICIVLMLIWNELREIRKILEKRKG